MKKKETDKETEEIRKIQRDVIKMTDLEKLKSVLDNQNKNYVQSGNYGDLAYEVKKEGYYLCLRVENLEVGFVFTKDGRLIGAYNCKQ